jgi:hypothetical protein
MPNEYILSPEEQDEVRGYLDARKEIEKQIAAALRMVFRQQHLEGNWTLNPEGTKLLKQVEPPAFPEQKRETT